jgi:hypothetical protein
MWTDTRFPTDIDNDIAAVDTKMGFKAFSIFFKILIKFSHKHYILPLLVKKIVIRTYNINLDSNKIHIVNL